MVVSVPVIAPPSGTEGEPILLRPEPGMVVPQVHAARPLEFAPVVSIVVPLSATVADLLFISCPEAMAPVESAPVVLIEPPTIVIIPVGVGVTPCGNPPGTKLRLFTEVVKAKAPIEFDPFMMIGF
jgi:hypothetical protein